MTQQFPLMVPGAAGTDAVVSVTAPFDDAAIADVAAADAAAVETALATAASLYADRDGWIAPGQRVEILEGTVELMSARAEELAVEAAREGGKPLLDSRVEVTQAIDGVRLCIEGLRPQSGTEIPMNRNAASANRLAMTTHEPIGVVVAVSAFNHPLNLIVHQVAPAVAVGCPVIVKPGELRRCPVCGSCRSCARLDCRRPGASLSLRPIARPRRRW